MLEITFLFCEWLEKTQALVIYKIILFLLDIDLWTLKVLAIVKEAFGYEISDGGMQCNDK